MGKRLIQQARGKGSPRYKSPSFNYKGEAKHRKLTKEPFVNGTVIDIIKCRGHTAPLAIIGYDDGEYCLTIAPEGIKVGQTVNYGTNVEVNPGNVASLSELPEGTLVYNIESKPGDGGKFCRASGSAAKIVSKMENTITVVLPSKKRKVFDGGCRANIGVAAGGGRTDKPLMKAGNSHYKMRSKNKLYPIVSGGAQNAVDHPFGNARTSRKSKAKPTSKNAPPGRKVGMVGPKRTGRKKK